MKYTESDIEQATLEWFGELGYSIEFGPDISPQPDNSTQGVISNPLERETFEDVVLIGRLKNAIQKINPAIPEIAREEALRKVLRVAHVSSNLIENNKIFYSLLRDGVEVEYRREDGSIAGNRVRLVDYQNKDSNDWLVVNQFTIIENNINRRPDVLIFLNGLPLVVIELKNPADEKATVKNAFNQLQTYKTQIPTIFTYNQFLIASDGIEAKVGSITANYEWFMRWRTMDGETVAPNSIPQLEVLIKGVFTKENFLDIIEHFIVFEVEEEKITKKIAGYHQYHATNKAIKRTLEATSEEGDRRCGVVWHTQGSGKSLTMVFYAGKLIQTLNNPTLVVLTDRNDLDDQLFGTFSKCQGALRQTPVQALNRNHLAELLEVASGGVVFTTIQKFFPEKGSVQYQKLSDRKNIVVMADEAHRSQYDFIDGFARHMRDALPNASFIGFTGTPIELTDANTRAVFGEYVDVYDVAQAVEDHATVPIYYEPRLAKIDLLESEKPRIDPSFEEVTEGEEVEKKEQLKSRWARLEAMVGSEKRVSLIAKDIVDHFENRLSTLDGKGMIVTMSRRIAVELYQEIIKLRPLWHSDDDKQGFIKVVMTGSASDPLNFQPHIRNKQRREEMADRFKKSDSSLKLVIVRDMWLTGFDVPCLHTMYLDKPIKGHGLMQTIARVNRVYKDKPGGLVVDYLGIAPMLKEALANYTQSGSASPMLPQEEAVSIMLEKYEIVKTFYHGFDYSVFFTSPKASERTNIISAAIDYVLGQEDGKKRYIQSVAELSQAFSLSVPNEEAIKIRDEVALFQGVKAGITKIDSDGGETGKSDEDYEHAIKQIVSNAIVTNEVVDIFNAVGLNKPNIAILSDEFLEDVKNMEHKNLAFEALKKLLSDSIKTMSRTNLVKSRSFAEMLETTIKKYQNQTIESAQIIAELIELAKKIREEQSRGEKLGLTSDEVAFYEALANNESAIETLGDDTLKKIAIELVELIRKNATIDWTIRESVQARLRIYVRRLLNKYGYPPDKQELATRTVLEQAELLCRDWGESLEFKKHTTT
jgi:type I restriction enzyme R subunit